MSKWETKMPNKLLIKHFYGLKNAKKLEGKVTKF